MSRAALEDFLASPLARFESWRTPDGDSPQGEFLRAAATHRRRVFRSGNRVGKTTAGAVDTLLHLLGWHPWGDKRTPSRWWAAGLDWEFGVGQVLWPAVRELLPMDQVRTIAWYRRAEPSIPLSIMFRNGSQLDFKSSDAGRRKFQGANLDGVWLDEEHPADVVEEARARLLKNKGFMTVTLTPIQRMRWVQDLEREEGTKIVRASMLDAAKAGLLDEEEVRRFAASLPERQRRVRVFGDFVALEGQVYPELTRETHSARPTRVNGVGSGSQLICQGKAIAPWPLPPEWPRWAAIDWGYANPTAVVIAAADPHKGRLIIERCYYSPGIRASAWAKLLQRRLPRLRVPLISDHDAQARAECEAGGVATIRADKDVEKGIEAVHRMIADKLADDRPALVFAIDEQQLDKQLGRCDAEKVLWEGELYHYTAARDGRPDPRDAPVKRDDHALDALRYLVNGWQRSAGGPPRPPRIRDRKEQRDDDDADMLAWPKGGF